MNPTPLDKPKNHYNQHITKAALRLKLGKLGSKLITLKIKSNNKTKKKKKIIK